MFNKSRSTFVLDGNFFYLETLEVDLDVAVVEVELELVLH